MSTTNSEQQIIERFKALDTEEMIMILEDTVTDKNVQLFVDENNIQHTYSYDTDLEESNDLYISISRDKLLEAYKQTLH